MSKNFVDNIVTAAANLAEATYRETELEDNRITAKIAAIDRIMSAGENQFTGKPHSYSSAESIVNTDEEYQAYLAKLRSATRDRILARGNYDACLAAARLQESAHV